MNLYESAHITASILIPVLKEEADLPIVLDKLCRITDDG